MTLVNRNVTDMADPPPAGELKRRQVRLRALLLRLGQEADDFLDAHLEWTLAGRTGCTVAPHLPAAVWLCDLLAGAIHSDNLIELSEQSDELADTLRDELDALLPLDGEEGVLADNPVYASLAGDRPA